MAAKRRLAEQSVDPFLSAHEREDDWPIARGVDARGGSTYVCRSCGEELPDGVAVEASGRGARAVNYAAPGPDDETGEPVAVVIHECGG